MDITGVLCAQVSSDQQVERYTIDTQSAELKARAVPRIKKKRPGGGWS